MGLTIRIIIFLILNFTALAIGGFFTGGGVSSDWYANLNKAPWTPPGWVFGAAWTSIMICFSIYMGILHKRLAVKKNIIRLFILQLLLNISWNPLFFFFQSPITAFVSILLLTVLIFYFFIKYRKTNNWASLLILPYFIWLCIATSLNFYIIIYN